MSFDNPRSFDDPSPMRLGRSDRDALAKLGSLALNYDQPGPGDRPFDGGRAWLAKSLYDQRRLRDQYLPADFFGEPIWDILLILYWARQCQRRLTVSAVCASAAAPNTTALRYIEHLCRIGYVTRKPHPTDRRMYWLSLSEEADQKVGRYLDRFQDEREARVSRASGH